MKKWFSYAILQYKHSALLHEALNVGVLFLFPDESKVHFEAGSLTRLRAAYPNFDTSNVSNAVSAVKARVKEFTGVFSPFVTFQDEVKFRDHILRRDDSSLQFTEFRKVPYSLDNIQKIIEDYSTVLLPKREHSDRDKHDEKYIIKQYTKLIQEARRDVNIPLKRNVEVEWKGVRLKFDVSWQNGTTNLVKPISFDLVDRADIQNKSVQYFGYLTKLDDYAKKYDINYHLIVGKPRSPELLDEYQKAIDIIKSAQAPKRIIKEDDLKSYSEETANYLADKIMKELDDNN